MKKLMLLLLIGLAVFVTLYRQRIFVWDPVASVARENVKQSHVRVMINYSNDVLLEDNSTSTRRLYLVQNWDKVARFSTSPLKCIQYLACMTDADRAGAQPFTPGPRRAGDSIAGVTMTNRRVEFIDESGALTVVSLR